IELTGIGARSGRLQAFRKPTSNTRPPTSTVSVSAGALPEIGARRRRALMDAAAEAAGAAAAAERADELAVLVDRQLERVAAEVHPDTVHVQILLDVREIERRHRRAVLLQPGADGLDRLRSREIADDGDQEIPAFERLEDLPVLFGREIAAKRAGRVGRHHQV